MKEANIGGKIMNKLIVTKADYQLCQDALNCIKHSKPSTSRMLAAFNFGSCERWSAIVNLWRNAYKRVPTKNRKYMKQVTIFKEKPKLLIEFSEPTK